MSNQSDGARPSTKAPKRARVSDKKVPSHPDTGPPNGESEAARVGPRLDDVPVDSGLGRAQGRENVQAGECDDFTQHGPDHPAGGTPAKLPHVIELLGRGCTKAEVARRLGISDRTVRRWLAENPESAELIDERLDEYTNELVQGAVEIGHAALPVLAALLNDDNPAIRLRAVSIALTHGAERIDINRIERKLEWLRTRLDPNSSGWEALENGR